MQFCCFLQARPVAGLSSKGFHPAPSTSVEPGAPALCHRLTLTGDRGCARTSKPFTLASMAEASRNAALTRSASRQKPAHADKPASKASGQRFQLFNWDNRLAFLCNEEIVSHRPRCRARVLNEANSLVGIRQAEQMQRLEVLRVQMLAFSPTRGPAPPVMPLAEQRANALAPSFAADHGSEQLPCLTRF